MTDAQTQPPEDGSALFRVLHAKVAGRLRVRIEPLYRRTALEEVLERELERLPGVHEARASALTGTLLVRFAPDTPAQEVLDALPRILGMGEVPAPRAWRPEARHRLKRADSKARSRKRKKKPSSEVRHHEEQPTRAWHACEATEALSVHDSSERGLTDEAAAERLGRFGPNVLERHEGRSHVEILLDQVKSAPTLMLVGSAVLSVATGGVGDALAIVAVVITNGAIGYATESSAERTLGSLERGSVHEASVLRDGAFVPVEAEQIVPGDVVRLHPGDTVPADGRLLRAQSLIVDESSLTGESVPVTKSADLLDEPKLPLADRLNMVYRGTVVVGGSGLAVVVATGKATEIGHIAALAGGLGQRETPLQRQLEELSRTLVGASLAVCGGVLAVGALRGFRSLQLLKVAVSLAVAAVPEGLPTVATTTLALGIRRMRGLDVLVRRLGAVETLGAVQTICLDKTGTITQNRMVTTELVTFDRTLHVEDAAISCDGQQVSPQQDDTLRRLLEVVVLCSEVEVEGSPGAYELDGSATETALVRVSLQAGMEPEALREAWPILETGHRTQHRQFMYTLHGDARGRPALVAVKGRPSEVLERCQRIRRGGESTELDDETRQQILAENERMAGDALRVLAVAYRELPDGETPREPADALVWLGLAGMVDPPREGIAELLGRFHAAGIDTVMITGDQSATAQAIARQIGLARDGQLEILDSTRLDELEPEVLRSLAQRAQVFSRVSPAHKLAIVQALQDAGRVVAMTGDGINDGPALKAADVGVAMGESGTEAARDVADVVLLTDELHAMITAIEQGRTTYDDVKKALQFILATNMTEIVMTFGAVAGGIPEPLTPMQLLWINLLTDIFPELALAVQPAEADVLTRPPRDPDRPMFTRGDLGWVGVQGGVISASALAVYGYGVARYGLGPQARTLGFTGLTCAQLLHAFSARSEKHSLFDPGRLAHDPYLPATVVSSLGLQVLAVAVPSLRRLLGTTPLSLADMLVALTSSLAPFVTNEALKVWHRNGSGRRALHSAVNSEEPNDAA